ncbi:MAG TPA: oxidoreductase [Gallionellaceae bacterium]|nr:oxidoreductase [Gallionellaceae bacterium]
MSYRAYRIFNEDNKTVSRWVELTLDDLDPGEVVIRTAYSSVNYKDALAATGAGKVIRRFPCVGGIDVSGVVESSLDARFKPGDEVLVTGYDMGVAHDGGFSERVRVPADWVVRLPKGLSLHDAMALGTAGFTAALSIHRLEQNDVKPENGKVVMTGASGGVGSLAICMLKNLGYHVVAITGKDSEHDYLKALGAAEVLPRSVIDLNSTRPLEKSLWAAALDSVGGATLAWLTRTMQQNGVIASFGNAGGVELNTTVLPFILRGVRLIGIDSAATAMPVRQKIWHRLANDLRPQQLDLLAHTVSFEQLPQVFPKMLSGESRGRTVIKIAA